MKRVVFGGFCLVSGVLLLFPSFFVSCFDIFSVSLCDNFQPSFFEGLSLWHKFAIFAGVPLFVLGLVLGLPRLKEEMNKVVFGGFCLVSGVLLLFPSCFIVFFEMFVDEYEDYYVAQEIVGNFFAVQKMWQIIAIFAGIPLFVFGLVLGFLGLKKIKKSGES